jgi:transposase
MFMRMHTLSKPEVILGLQDEIRRTEEARYDHRLHTLLMVAQGKKCSEVAELFGDAQRTVQYWVQRFEKEGFAGLYDAEKPGRPRRLSEEQMQDIGAVLRGTPKGAGLRGHIWDGKTLSAYIMKRYSIPLGVRQCQRMFSQLGFRLRKPRPVIAHADPEQQAGYKKTEDDYGAR